MHAFFPYYGSKIRISRRLPPPRYSAIHEAFAGSTAYATQHPHCTVVLAEADPVIREVWRWLIRVSATTLLALPDIPPDGTTDVVDNPEARAFVGAG